MYRWSVCPGSVALSKGIHAPTSEYAAEGTCAHDLADACLSHSLDAATYLGQKRTADGFDFIVSEEMVEGVQLYLDTVRGALDKDKGDVLYSEHEFDLGAVYPGLWGTNDALVWKPTTRTLKVYDFKYGAGIAVEVKRNKQLMYYALGAVLQLKLPVMTVELCIVQPRCPHPDGPVRRDVMNALDLLDFQGELALFAAATQKENAPLKAGDHCRFCPAAGVCPELHKLAQEAAQTAFDVVDSTLNPFEDHSASRIDYAKLADALKLVPIMKAWCANVDSLAYKEAEAGAAIPGFKLVDKVARRQWRDVVVAELSLKELGLGETEMYPMPELKSPAQIEEVLKGKSFKPKERNEVLAPLVEKKSSGKALVPESDKRPSVGGKQSAAEAFASA
jgi:hypothetical protein